MSARESLSKGISEATGTLHGEELEKAVLLQQALSQASAVRAQKRKQLAMCSTEIKECCRSDCSSADVRLPRDCEEASNKDSDNTGEKSTEQRDYVVLIKNHKLYPVLELMLKKCEVATWNMTPSCFAIDDVLQLFAELETENGAVLFGNEELDNLLSNAILMLRIHLIELSKVADLCDDFMMKYTQSLKKKMNQESMIGLSVDSDEELGPLPACTDLPNQMGSRFATNAQSSSKSVAMLTTTNGMVSIPLNLWDTTSANSPLLSGGVMEGTSAVTANCSSMSVPPEAIGSEYSSSRAGEGSTEPMYSARFSPEDEQNDSRRKSLLPSKAVDVLKSWIFLHASHPYPSEDEKSMLSKETGLQMAQINNWFINARRRLLPSKLDSPSQTEADDDGRQGNDWAPSTKRIRKDSKSDQLPHSVRNFFPSDDVEAN